MLRLGIFVKEAFDSLDIITFSLTEKPIGELFSKFVDGYFFIFHLNWSGRVWRSDVHHLIDLLIVLEGSCESLPHTSVCGVTDPRTLFFSVLVVTFLV